MKYSLSIDPTEENLIKSLNDDILGLNIWINRCLNVFSKMDNSIIAIDAKWGNGKTFIAKQMEFLINSKLNAEFGNADVELNNIKNLNFAEIPLKSSYAIYYNAWEYDNDNNPIVSFLYFLLKILNKRFNTLNFHTVANGLIKNVIEKITDGWLKIDSNPNKNDIEKILSSVITSENIKQEIDKLLQELKSERCNKLIIFIDELDRCRPNYALKVMELLKHYFKRDDILVVCMCDIEQLAYSIENIYGIQNKAYQYLDKIIDFRFEIPIKKIDYLSYIRYKTNNEVNSSYFFDMVVLEIIGHFNLSLRNIDRYLCYLKNMFIKTNKTDGDIFPIKGLVLYLFIPYYLAVKLFDEKSYNDLIKLDFNEFIKFSYRENVRERIKQIYNYSSYDCNNEYLDSGLKTDLTQVMKIINGEKIDAKFIISKNSYYIESYIDVIKEIDLLSYFSKNMERLKQNE